MANTIMPTYFSSGVRRLKPVATLGRWPMLGAVADTAQGMINEGFDPGTVNTLVALGATDAQLQGLWDAYQPNTLDFSNAAQSLLLHLSGSSAPPITASTMQTSAAGTAYGDVSALTSSIIQFGSQTLDMMQDSSWKFLNQQFQAAQQQLNALIKQFPGDATVIGQINQFNTLVQQFASYWQQVYGSALNPVPTASLSGMGTLGIPPLIILGIVAGVALMAAGLYAIIQWISVKKTQATTAQVTAASTAATTSSLTSSYQQQIAGAAAATAAGNPALAAQLTTQANATLAAIQKLGGTAPPTTQTFSEWFQANWGYLMIGLGAIIIIPAALRRR